MIARPRYGGKWVSAIGKQETQLAEKCGLTRKQVHRAKLVAMTPLAQRVMVNDIRRNK